MQRGVKFICNRLMTSKKLTKIIGYNNCTARCFKHVPMTELLIGMRITEVLMCTNLRIVVEGGGACVKRVGILLCSAK